MTEEKKDLSPEELKKVSGAGVPPVDPDPSGHQSSDTKQSSDDARSTRGGAGGIKPARS